MVPLAESPLLNLDTASVHLIDTTNTDNLHAFWSVCSRCAKTDALPNSKRLENLSWRIYSQQTLSRSSERLTQSYTHSERNLSAESVPELSSSLGSPVFTGEDVHTPPDVEMSSYLIPLDNSPKVISPVKLETLVKSVTDTDQLEPLIPLPTTICDAFPMSTSHTEASTKTQHENSTTSHQDTQLRVPSPIPEQTQSQFPMRSSTTLFDPSTSTATLSMDNGEVDGGYLAPTESTSSDRSSSSIIRGFSKDQISRSRRSVAQLAPPPPILKQSSPARVNPLIKPTKKKATFMIGASSEGDDASSYESPQQNSMAQRLQSYSVSFEANHSESAIEDEDDDEDEGDWEEVDEASQQEDLFQRVESSTNLRSRPSLLTNMLHQQDRAKALQNAASRSTPAIRRSRTSDPNGPLNLSSIETQTQPQMTRNRAIPSFESDQAAESMPIALSPRTNRRNMLSTELTGSLRKHLLWERQQRNPGTKPLKNRQYRSEIALTDHTAKPPKEEPSKRNDANFYDNGLQEYFAKGW